MFETLKFLSAKIRKRFLIPKFYIIILTLFGCFTCKSSTLTSMGGNSPGRSSGMYNTVSPFLISMKAKPPLQYLLS